MQDEVTVTQADREAAYGAYFECYDTAPNDLWLQAMLEGRHDEDSLIQVLARHRHQAERETLARMEWRDIESAPKDGTRFLAWCPYVGRVIMRIDGVHRETWAIDPSGRLGCNPTKWMPLPPAPEAGQ